MNTFNFSENGLSIVGQVMFNILDLAKGLELQGKNIIHLELGEPKAKPSQQVLQAAVTSMRDGNTGYCSSYGVLALRKQIKAQLYDEVATVSVENIVISTANLLITQVLDVCCGHRDKVGIFTPCFPTYFASAKYRGLSIVDVPLSIDDGFLLNKQSVDQMIECSPRLIIVNSANNPTGAVYGHNELEYLVNACKEKGIWLLSDETYACLTYEQSFVSLVDFDYHQKIVISSFSKALSIPGFRVGYAVAHSEVTDKIALSTSTLVSCLPPFLQEGVAAALSDIDRESSLLAAYCHTTALLCADEMSKHKIVHSMPQSAFYMLIKIPDKYCGNDLQFAEDVLYSAHVAVTPGSAFGLKGFIRISICMVREDVLLGVAKISSFY